MPQGYMEQAMGMDQNAAKISTPAKAPDVVRLLREAYDREIEQYQKTVAMRDERIEQLEQELAEIQNICAQPMRHLIEKDALLGHVGGVTKRW